MTSRYTLTLSILLTGAVASAQPVLNTANHVPVVGQTVALRTGTNYTWEGPSGAGVTYNYWDLFPSATGNRNFYYAPPNGVPAADYATTDGGTDSTFWAVGTDGLASIGEKQPITGRVNYPQPLLELPLPLSFGSSWTSSVTVNYVALGFPVTRLATVSGTADAYGQLNLPNANSVEVLRVKVRRDISDSSVPLNLRRIINFHSFFTASSAHPVMKLQVDSLQIGTGGAWTVTRSVELSGAGALVGIDEYNAAEAYFNAYPNPANDAVTIQLNGPASHVELIDAKGAIVRTLNGTSDQVRLDLYGLDAGHYLIRAYHDGKALETRPLVVE